MSGYGTQLYGVGSWGLNGSSLPVAGAMAYAVGDRKVRVILDSEPQHSGSTLTGDALNPRTWTITEPATGKVWTVMSVAMVDKFTYDLVTLEIFPNHFGTLELETTTLIAITGLPFPTITETFNGAYLDANSTDQKRTTARGYSPKDLLNAQVPTQGAVGDVQIGVNYGEMVGGTLQIESGGDYASMSGDAFVRKLILRRLISKRGDFFHLPEYGAGLREKEPVPTVDLRKIAVQIEQQVALEKEVAEVRASLTYAPAASALLVNVKARIKPSGDVVQVALPVPTGTMQF